MPASLIVVDDFLNEPMPFREAALRLTYPPQAGAFPGRNSAERLEVAGLREEVERITGERLRPIDPPRSHAKCRITLADDQGTGGVHIDPGYWSGIFYLSLPEHARGGTDFYRHQRTGLDRVPNDPAEIHAAGYSSADSLAGDLLRDGPHPDRWEHVMSVPMRFNRLVLLRPWLWHSAAPGFGHSPADGRLIFVMFFDRRG